MRSIIQHFLRFYAKRAYISSIFLYNSNDAILGFGIFFLDASQFISKIICDFTLLIFVRELCSLHQSFSTCIFLGEQESRSAWWLSY